MTISRATPAGNAYLDLRNLAKRQGRPTNELLNLYALEGFLERLSKSEHTNNFALKGGVLLAAFDTRRATRDVDLQADALSNDSMIVEEVISAIASFQIDDGLIFNTASTTSEVIRDDDEYAGVRVTMPCTLATADVSFHVDVNVGDAIWPEPEMVNLPRLLGGTLRLRGYSIEMVIAEKIVTAIQRGTANTRWRDFCDLYQLSRKHSISEATLRRSITTVSSGRSATIVLLAEALAGYEAIAQAKWSAWVHKQGLDDRIPIDFKATLDWIEGFADPILVSENQGRRWDFEGGSWRRNDN